MAWMKPLTRERDTLGASTCVPSLPSAGPDSPKYPVLAGQAPEQELLLGALKDAFGQPRQARVRWEEARRARS